MKKKTADFSRRPIVGGNWKCNPAKLGDAKVTAFDLWSNREVRSSGQQLKIWSSSLKLRWLFNWVKFAFWYQKILFLAIRANPFILLQVLLASNYKLPKFIHSGSFCCILLFTCVDLGKIRCEGPSHHMVLGNSFPTQALVEAWKEKGFDKEMGESVRFQLKVLEFLIICTCEIGEYIDSIDWWLMIIDEL